MGGNRRVESTWQVLPLLQHRAIASPWVGVAVTCFGFKWSQNWGAKPKGPVGLVFSLATSHSNRDLVWLSMLEVLTTENRTEASPQAAEIRLPNTWGSSQGFHRIESCGNFLVFSLLYIKIQFWIFIFSFLSNLITFGLEHNDLKIFLKSQPHFLWFWIKRSFFVIVVIIPLINCL